MAITHISRELQAFIRARMELDGDYHVTNRSALQDALRKFPVAPGDTVSVHPDGGGVPTLYEVDHRRELRQIWPTESP